MIFVKNNNTLQKPIMTRLKPLIAWIIVLSYSNQVLAATYAVQAGDTVSILANYSSPDPNELYENEPLVVNDSSGICSFTTYASRYCQYQATAAGSVSIDSSILGYDGDENSYVGVNIFPAPPRTCDVPAGGFSTCRNDPPPRNPPDPNNPTPPDDRNNGPQNCNGQQGHPIFPANGNVYHDQEDFVGSGLLKVIRSYNSNSGVWSHNYLMRVTTAPATSGHGATAKVVWGTGRSIIFYQNGSNWNSDATVAEQLTALDPANNNGAVWQVIDQDDTVTLFNADGEPIRQTVRGGDFITFAYQNKLLTQVTDSGNRSIKFNYDAKSRVSGFTTPKGEVYQYGYDNSDRLTSIKYPDGTSKQYVYENQSYVYALTGIFDENNKRFETWTYDQFGRGLTNQSAGGVNKYSITYNPNDDRQVMVTDPLGTQKNLTYQEINSNLSLAGSTQPCPTCGKDSASKVFDDSNNIIQKTDFNGNSSNYSYNNRHLITQQTLASNTPDAQTTSIQWSSSFRLPTQMTQGNRTILFEYDANGNMTKRTVTGTAPVATRTTLYTWDTTGHLTSYTDALGHVTKYTYDAQGNRITETNALNQTSQFSYDADGRLVTLTNPNGLKTTYSYDSKGRITSRTIGNEKTGYSYDSANNLVNTTLPDGSFFIYTYDDAHRLTTIINAWGEQRQFTLDAMGNQVAETIIGAGGQIYSHKRTFNANNLKSSDVGASGQTTLYQYDSNQNLVSATDPLNRITALTYDGLNRLRQTTAPDGGVRHQDFDTLDHLVAATDPLGITTSYSVDALNNVVGVQSADAGNQVATYDANGNVTSRVDAKQQTTQYAYDALNRLIKTTYADGRIVTYVYDQGVNGIGHLTAMQDLSGTSRFSYDKQGWLAHRIQRVSNQTLNIAYTYSAGGHIANIRYPSGSTVKYSYDKGRVQSVDVNGSNFIKNILHNALDRLTSWTFWNGETATRTYDQDNRLTTTERGAYAWDAASQLTSFTPTNGQAYQFSYDAAGRLAQTQYPYNASKAPDHFVYDKNDNLFTKGFGQYTVEYDSPVGVASGTTNRINSRIASGPAAAPSSGTGSPTPPSGGGADNASHIDFDANGSITRYENDVTIANSVSSNQGVNSATATENYTYDAAGRMNTAKRAGNNANYTYDGFGIRASKSGSITQTQAIGTNTGTVSALQQLLNWLYQLIGIPNPQPTTATQTTNNAVYAYAGTQLLGEYDGANAQEYIWLNDMPVGVMKGGALYAIHTDQLNTPRDISDYGGKTVWSLPLDSYGETQPTGQLIVNLRYSGQYYDAETGKSYNTFRDYSPTLGRYLEADPIGLNGGMNPFMYVGGEPVLRMDPFGLDYVYRQSTGQITHVDSDGNTTNVGMGYAGQNAGLNNPANQGVSGTGPNSNGGPLPQGTYDMALVITALIQDRIL